MNILWVVAVDATGDTSREKSHSFVVATPSPRVASRPLEQGPWQPQPYADDGRTVGFDLVPSGDATLDAGSRVIGAKTTALHGAGALSTTTPVVRTDHAYTVAT
ncbi:hypothetical protein Afil01_07440 [Actinorhabdospora filicis]|uniref:Uncharacterized protein n=1 Tax=Actinorhabdospora filicis TaxID=1785913 RepID=A0A9W6W1I5_9ACTN|nr:hypothetical protein [Actinorhabdospora filicis]GLZ75937.1 hypothetical protein Afil01_07440 [Actinorhabdospora filicis]